MTTVSSQNDAPFFSIRNVSRTFSKNAGFLREKKLFLAVDDVSLDVLRGQTLGLVGESGCGKSTLARMSVRLLRPTMGDIYLQGQSIFSKDPFFAKALPSRIQMVFQDPFSSLDPRLSIGKSVGEALLATHVPRKEREERVAAMLNLVGMAPEAMGRYPHEFSGGQRQRIAIARALMTNPDFLVLDEPVSSLDASVQAQVLILLKNLQEQFSLTYLFISHDLAVISHMSDRVAVMRAGKILEEKNSEELFTAPEHPYTKSLLAATPTFYKRRSTFAGDVCHATAS